MKKILKTLLLVIIIVGIWQGYVYAKEKIGRSTLGTGSINVGRDGEWNLINVSGCRISTLKTDLINGIWLGPWDGLSKKTLAPDHNAVYYQVFLPVLPVEKFGEAYFEIKGEFPESRFMSYHLYSDKFVIESDSHFMDVLIKPDSDSVNPFISGYPLKEGEKKNYTLKIIDFKKMEAGKNDNPLWGGEVKSGAHIEHHSLMLRYYDPQRKEGVPAGIVDRPKVIFKYKDSDPIEQRIKDNPCLMFDYNWYNNLSKLLKGDSLSTKLIPHFENLAGKINYPGYLGEDQNAKPEWIYGGNMMCTILEIFPTGPISSALDTFSKKFSGRSPKDFLNDGECAPEFGRGAFNYDNRYIYSFLDVKRGPAVITMKNMVGAKYGQNMLSGNEDLRYWSLCVLQLENLMYTHTCLRNDEVLTNPDRPGYVSFIFTKRNEKPAWACDMTLPKDEREKDCKYNWLPYVSPINWLYMRTLAGNPSSPAYKYLPITYELGKNDPNDSSLLKEHMGPYYPEGEYCSVSDDSCLNILGNK